MRGTFYRGLAVGVTSAALVLGGAVAATATPDVPDGPEADHAGAVGAPWLPGTVARSIRQTQVPGERYEAAAAELAATRRADALALAHGALRAARSVDAVAGAVDAETVDALTRGVADLSALLGDAGFAEVQVGAAPGVQRIPDADVAPTPVAPERDLVLAGAIQDAAGEVYRLSLQVEVAAREAEVDEPIGGPGDLRAPAALEPVEDADEDAAAGDGGGDATEGEGAPAASSDDGEPGAGSAEGPQGSQGADASDTGGAEGDETAGSAEGSDGGTPDASDAAATTEGADTTDTTDSTGTAETPGVDGAAGTDAEGADDGGSSAAATEDAEDAEDAEPAALDALPAELVEGLADLENAVAAASALLSSDILDLEQVPFLTPERARLLALAQGLDGDDVAAWSQWQNGRIPTDQLCGVAFAPDRLLRCDAAYALEMLNVEYRAEFGEDMGIVSAYRTYEQQVHLKATKGWLAATPGRSNHGWGLAVDLAKMGGLRDYSSPRYRWMVENGPAYGWHHPRSMQPGGSGPPEPWHFEFGRGAGSAGAAQPGLEMS